MTKAAHFLKRSLLPLSLGLNLFFLGAVASDLLTRPARAWPDHSSESIAADIVKILPAPDAKVLRDAVESRHQEFQKARRDYLAAYVRLRFLLTTEPFDPAAFKEASLQVEQDHQIERQVLDDVITGTLGAMSPEARHAIVTTQMTPR